MLAFKLSKKDSSMTEPITTIANPDGGQQVAEGTQPEPMPSSNEPKPAETPGDTSAGELPEGVSERTAEQFEKLTAKNQELQTALKQKEDEAVASSIFDVFNSGADTIPAASGPQPPATPPVAPAPKAVSNKAAEQALLVAQQTRQDFVRAEQARQEKEAYAKHSWLDPKAPEFNQEAMELVQGQVISAYAKGQPIDLTSIADKVAPFVKPVDVNAAATQAVDQYKEDQGKKAVTAPVGGAAPSGAYGDAALEDLKKATLVDPAARRERIERALKK